MPVPPQAHVLCSGLDILHDDDDLSVRTLRDRVPDGQAVRRKIGTVGTWQGVCFGKWVASVCSSPSLRIMRRPAPAQGIHQARHHLTP